MPLLRLFGHKFQKQIERLFDARALRGTEYARLFAGPGLNLHALYDPAEIKRAGAPALGLLARRKKNISKLDAARIGSRNGRR